MNHANTVSWKNRAESVIAQSALTNSKRPQSFVEGVYPSVLRRGRGCYVFDDQDKKYVDYICALGTNILGYARREVMNAAMGELTNGHLLSLGTTKEVEFGETIRNYFPFVEQIKVLKSGTSGCDAAMRIARAYTGRDVILSDGYHGHSDDGVYLTPPASGVPGPRPWIQPLRMRDENLGDDVAAVIVEPVITDASTYRISYLQALRALCARKGVLFIADETITALRFPGLSFSKYTGIHPDLIVFGKALANGLPISVVGGSKKIMSSNYFISTSFAGDTMPMAAAEVTLRMVRDAFPAMSEAAERFCKGFNAIAKDLVQIEGYGMRGVFKSRDELTQALFFQEACKAGILFGPSFFWCEPHAEESHFVLSACATILNRIKNNEVRLEGKMPQKAYAAAVREKNG